MTSKNEEKEERDAVTVSGYKTYCGVPFRQNVDGTKTWYPKTKVTFFTPNDYKILKQHLTADEMNLIERNLVKGISDTDEHRRKRVSGLPEPSPEWKEALDLHYSVQRASDKEYLFVATRRFEESEVVAVAHLSLGTKGTIVAEFRPARVSVYREATIDVCRGKSEHSLRLLLKSVGAFFDAWALFQIQVDQAETGGCSCNYKLTLSVPNDNDDLSTHLGKRVAEYIQVWSRPTIQMCQSWGYETTTGLRRATATNETLFRICKKP